MEKNNSNNEFSSPLLQSAENGLSGSSPVPDGALAALAASARSLSLARMLCSALRLAAHAASSRSKSSADISAVGRGDDAVR